MSLWLPEEDLRDDPVAALPGDVEADGQGQGVRQRELRLGVVVGARDHPPPGHGHYVLELETITMRRFVKISQSRRGHKLGPSPG